MNEKIYMTGLYLRLSKDDERAGESVSIENQRLLLTKYAEDRGWEIKEIYIDDGWSGTNFQRPAFQRMMRDVEEKKINLIAVKDLSRLGRNYIEVGRLTEETLPNLGCRFVALNDSVDSMLGENDMMVYRNLFNEFYSRDTSKKVRAVKKACAGRGQYMGAYAPFGYEKDPLDKHHLIPDEETAHLVRRIFEMRCSGMGYRTIAVKLNEEHIASPRDLCYRRLERENPRRGNGRWNDSTVRSILRSEVYIGHMVQGKYESVSYKNRKLISKPRDQWIRVENTHEPLVSMELWEMARRLQESKYKPRTASGGERSKFVGLLKCADCGFNMRAQYERGRRKSGEDFCYTSFLCSNYTRSGKEACTSHIISESALTELVLGIIREHANLAVCDEERVVDRIMSAKSRENVACIASYTAELKSAEARLAQLDKIIRTLYEDRVAGIVSDGMFKPMMDKYERERADKTETVTFLRGRVEELEKQWCDVDAWLRLIRKYAALETLTADILWELVESIRVHQPETISGQRVCRVDVVYRFVGSLDETSAKAPVGTRIESPEMEAPYGKAV
ncbi:MAG: recombinase family protein [Synergistaceae bacterium]|jgi:DNA invertase Pin-like site-specific DNA recombinase|nr:recombinase family protein [Synergistaceae bacterium]